MQRWLAAVVLGLAVGLVGAQEKIAKTDEVKLPHFEYEEARGHEIAPHRRTIPTEGAQGGFNQLALTLIISATGEVVKAEANGDAQAMKFWPVVEGEVEQWRFVPFEKDGKAVVAEVKEYVDLVPPERLPKVHVKAPELRPESKVAITLERSGCLGSCPGYKVTVGTDGIVFEGGYYVVATGRHTAPVDADAVRALAKRFVAADFYSLDEKYVASVTDMPGYSVAIEIDGKAKKVDDYVGQWEGMPGVVSELELAVDKLAETQRWIKGTDGLVELLKAEKYNFASFDGQVMLKAAAQNGQAATVSEMLAAGVPLQPLPAPKKKSEYEGIPFAHVGWLNASAGMSEVLEELIAASASKDDQADKDLALNVAAGAGEMRSVRALIAYGANPNADLRRLTVTENGGAFEMSGRGAGNILISAAESGNPELVREILRYHPKLEAKDREGKTAMFAAGDYRSSDVDGARVECVRLLAEAGARVNARDNEGNTPLHETFLTDVEEELLKLGADVNARNEDGETPIFTTVDNDAMVLFLEHGADLKIRNKKGQTVVEAAEGKGPLRVKALKEAIYLTREKR